MDETWELKLEIKLVEGMNDWRFFFADGSDMVLNTSEPLYVRSTKPSSSIEPYPLPLSTHTYCTLAHDSTSSNLTYEFSWGDGFPPVTVSKKHSEVACAEHVFCHPEFGCFGETPRNVTVTVTNECGEKIVKSFASELSLPTKEDINPRCAPPPTDSPPTELPTTEIPSTMAPSTLVPTSLPAGSTFAPVAVPTLVPTEIPTSKPVVVLTYSPDTQAPTRIIPTAMPTTPAPPTACATFSCDNSTTCIIDNMQPTCTPRGGCLPGGELCPVGTICGQSLKCECDPAIKKDCELHGVICNPNEGSQNTCVEDMCRQFVWPPTGLKFCSEDTDCPSTQSCTACTENCVCNQITGNKTCDGSCRRTCEDNLFPCPSDGSTLQNASWCCIHKQIGCTDYNCFEGAISTWYQGKKDYCCQKVSRGCNAQSGVINCYDPMLEWTYNEISYCCGQKNIYCPVPPHNCTDEAAAVNWDINKRLYCCSQGVGCDKFECQWDGASPAPWSEEQKDWCCKNKGERCTTHTAKSCLTLGNCEYSCQDTPQNRKNWQLKHRQYCCLQFGIECQLDTSMPDCFSASAAPGWTALEQKHCCFEHDVGCGVNCFSSDQTAQQKSTCCSDRGIGCPFKLTLPERYFSLKYRSMWAVARKNPIKLSRQLLTSLYKSSATLTSAMNNAGGVNVTIYYVGTLMAEGRIPKFPTVGGQDAWGFAVDALWDTMGAMKKLTTTKRSITTLNEYVQQTYAADEDIRVLFSVDGGEQTDRDNVISELRSSLQNPSSAAASNNEGFSVILLDGNLTENKPPQVDTPTPGDGGNTTNTTAPSTLSPKSSDSFPVWALIVIIFGSLLVCGGVYAIYKKRSSDDGDESHDDMQMGFAGVYNDIECDDRNSCSSKSSSHGNL